MKGEGYENQKIIKFEFVNNIHKYIKLSSIFITRSPITAIEAISLGKRPIIIPILSDLNQATMANSLTNYLHNLSISTLNGKYLANLILESLLNDKSVKIDKTFTAKNGTHNASKKILQLAESF